MLSISYFMVLKRMLAWISVVFMTYK